MTLEQSLNYYKKYGFVFVPVNAKTKKPKSIQNKNGDWIWKGVSWSDNDFIAAGAAGIQHEQSNIIDVDIDNPKAIPFASLILEPTFTFKSPGGLHMLYKFAGDTRAFKCLSDRKKLDSVIVEVLHNTQTVFLGDGRTIINDREPVEIDQAKYERLLKQVGKISLLTMLSEHYPSEGSRDDFIMKVVGCLIRYSKLTTSEKEQFIEMLCTANKDRQDLKTRVNKIKRLEEKFKAGENTYGLDALAKEIDVDKNIVGNWFSFVGDQEITNTSPITALSLTEMLNKEYPPTKYLLDPILPEPCIIEVFGHEGSGKTLFLTGLVTALSQGQDFLKYKNHYKKRKPVLVVDAEMPENDLVDRYVNALQPYHEKKIEVDLNYIRIASNGEQLDHHFIPLNHEQGQTKVELQLEQMAKEFNEKPVLVLDNLTYLTELQEKDGVEFLPFMKWLIRLRSKGYCVIFIHHSTKEGSTSSGSNIKERPLDVNLQLREAKGDERILNNEDTQIIISVRKMRRYAEYVIKKDYIATCSRHTGAWKDFAYVKLSPVQKIFYSYFNKGITTWEESMKDEIAKSTFYNLLKKETNKGG